MSSPPFTEPRPKREDIPEEVHPADVLQELRLLAWEWRYWRAEVNGDIGFLRRFRSAINDSVRLLVIGIPVGAFMLAVLTFLR